MFISKEKLMNNITLSMATLIALSTSIYASEPTNQELLERIKVLENKNSTTDLPYATKGEGGSEYGKLIIGGDYRFSVDNLNYDLANGQTAKNDSLLTNRAWLNFSYKPNEHIDFNTKLAFNKVFGQPAVYAPGGKAPFDGFDWVASTTNTDDELRVKNAYINYRNDSFLGTNIPWDFGVGRRSTSYNKLNSLRDDMAPNSPLGHIVSAEFDGGHLGFKLGDATGVSGMSLKLAAGRGASYVMPSLSATPDADWGSDINMLAFNFVPYDDSVIHTELQAMHITNLIDIQNGGYDQQGAFNPANFNPAFDVVGDMYLGSFMTSYKLNNDAMLFASYAMSKSDPKSGKNMFGSTDNETGTSYWLGAQWKCQLTDNAKVGVEFNHGDKYWRSFTYAEDTVAGSKMATRGDAYEAYFTKQITDGLSFQARYTMMDYDYTGSNGFFGSQTGMPMKVADVKNGMANTDLAAAVVDKAQDLRFYLRYNF
jgi:hypothetical protein